VHRSFQFIEPVSRARRVVSLHSRAFKQPRLRKRLNEDLAFVVVVVVVSHVRFLDVFTDVTASRGGVEKTKIERRTGHRRVVPSARARVTTVCETERIGFVGSHYLFDGSLLEIFGFRLNTKMNTQMKYTNESTQLSGRTNLSELVASHSRHGVETIVAATRSHARCHPALDGEVKNDGDEDDAAEDAKYKASLKHVRADRVVPIVSILHELGADPASGGGENNHQGSDDAMR